MKVLLFGAEVAELEPEIAKYPCLTLCESDPDVVICYGGDGTLLQAELKWPGAPKAPIRNSRHGRRCIAHPFSEVIKRLAEDRLVRVAFMKLEGRVRACSYDPPEFSLSGMNEFNVHMGRINSAVRFRLWVNDEDCTGGEDIIGDGFVVSTPFGSTAYFHQITRGVFYSGIGIAFKNTAWHTNHFVVPQDAAVRMAITRGPAVLAVDNAPRYYDLHEGDELLIRTHPQPATVLVWEAMSHPCDAF